MSEASAKHTVLIVDDTPSNVALLSEVLRSEYRIKVAINGDKALQLAFSDDPPDLVLLDIMMPGLSGYDVCAQLKAEPKTRDIPLIFVTAMGEVDDETKGLALGGVDYVTKPISPPTVLARVKTHLALYEQKRQLGRLVAQLEQQAGELSEWNRTLAQRVAEGVAEVAKLARMKRFFSPQIADLILRGGTDDPMKSHRREITVVFLDLRGFTAFSETAEPEEVMGVLHDYHAEMGRLVMAHQGTIEHFAGDGIMIFFNDPVVIDNPAAAAVRMGIEMQNCFVPLMQGWKRRGFELHMGIGIAQGFATIGTVGFEGRQDYSAIGSVCNLASRLCSEARGGQILVSQRVQSFVAEFARTESVGELALKGFHKPVATFSVLGHLEGNAVG